MSNVIFTISIEDVDHKYFRIAQGEAAELMAGMGKYLTQLGYSINEQHVKFTRN